MENGDQVTKRGCLCPQDSRGGGVSNLNNPHIYLRHCLAYMYIMYIVYNFAYIVGGRNSVKKFGLHLP